MTRLFTDRIAIALAALAIHFVAVGLVAATEGVLLPRGDGFLALSQTAGWYINGAIVAPVLWVVVLPYVFDRFRTCGSRSVPLLEAAGLAIAINTVFFLMMLTDQASSFNSRATGDFWEQPYFTLIPNALQSTLLDVGIFLFVGVQIRTVFALDRELTPDQTALAAARLGRASLVAAPAIIGHFLSVAPAFFGRPTSSAGFVLLIFVLAAILEIVLFLAVHARARRLREEISARA